MSRIVTLCVFGSLVLSEAATIADCVPEDCSGESCIDFEAPRGLDVGSPPRDVVGGDFDADGHLDLVVAVSGFQGTGLLLFSGEGDGSFRSALVSDSIASNVVSADFNDDQVLDLATVGGPLDVSLGDGEGGFHPAWTFPLENRDDPRDLVAADFDGDGASDIAVLTRFDLILFLSAGDGSFSVLRIENLGGAALCAADFDGDGLADLARAGKWRRPDGAAGVVLLSLGDGSFRESHSFDPGEGTVIVEGDVNADGFVDLLLGTAKGVGVFLGRGDGTFDSAGTVVVSEDFYSEILLADLDGDRILDVTTPSDGYRRGLDLFLGRGDGTFERLLHLPAGIGVGRLLAEDFDGNGAADLVTVNGGSDDVTIILGKGGGRFETPSSLRPGKHPEAVVAADFDGDGRIDLATANSGSNDVTVFHGRGNGAFSPARSLPAGVGPCAMTTADLDGNGTFDLLSANSGSNDVSVILTRTDGTFEEARTFPAGGTGDDNCGSDFRCFALALDAADLDDDGLADVVVAHRCPNGLSLLFGSGDGTLGRRRSIVATEIPDFPTDVVATDVNGDGIADLVVALGESLGILLGRGGGEFDTMGFYENSAWSLIAVDVDGDGNVDLVTSYENDCRGCTGDVRLLRGNGNGTFREAEDICSGCARPGLIVPADMDGDGHVDIVTSYVDVVLGNGDGSFRAPVGFSLAGHSVALADFDDDGRMDVASVSGEEVRLLLSVPEQCRIRFVRGDCNDDGVVNVSDTACALGWLFAGPPEPLCVKAVDANDTGTVDVADAVYLLNFLFSGGPAPSSPFAECGPDPTPDELTCERFAPCI